MRILMLNRADALTIPGGDTVLMLETKRYLEALGAAVDVQVDTGPILGDYDIAHAFNIQKGVVDHTFRQLQRVKERSLPVALSPIYWDWIVPDEARPAKHLSWKGQIREWLRTAAHLEVHTAPELDLIKQKHIYDSVYQERMRACLYMADVLLPNAAGELDLLARNMTIPAADLHAHIIPAGVDAGWLDTPADPDRFRAQHNLADFILCVGRIEPSKNQLNLIRALEHTGFTLVCIGRPYPSYTEACRQEAAQRGVTLHILDHLSRGDLIHAFTAAKVHVLPSWRETPGLASMEAAALGCNIVVTPHGTTREYFGNHAFYCEPGDPASIRRAVEAALAANPQTALAQHIRTHFTWQKAASLTLSAYECALARLLPLCERARTLDGALDHG